MNFVIGYFKYKGLYFYDAFSTFSRDLSPSSAGKRQVYVFFKLNSQ